MFSRDFAWVGFRLSWAEAGSAGSLSHIIVAITRAGRVSLQVREKLAIVGVGDLHSEDVGASAQPTDQAKGAGNHAADTSKDRHDNAQNSNEKASYSHSKQAAVAAAGMRQTLLAERARLVHRDCRAGDDDAVFREWPGRRSGLAGTSHLGRMPWRSSRLLRSNCGRGARTGYTPTIQKIRRAAVSSFTAAYSASPARYWRLGFFPPNSGRCRLWSRPNLFVG